MLKAWFPKVHFCYFLPQTVLGDCPLGNFQFLDARETISAELSVQMLSKLFNLN